jgi:hypothetical protein
LLQGSTKIISIEMYALMPSTSILETCEQCCGAMVYLDPTRLAQSGSGKAAGQNPDASDSSCGRRDGLIGGIGDRIASRPVTRIWQSGA